MAASSEDIDAAVIEAANKAIDKAFAGLYEIFKERPRRPHEHFTRYDIVFENGEVRWVPNEIDRLVDEAIRDLLGEPSAD